MRAIILLCSASFLESSPLDVYKRQTYAPPLDGVRYDHNRDFAFRTGKLVEHVYKPVSYTHLWNGEENVLEADAVLVATGRQPNTRGLALEAAGVEQTERGAVKTDKFLCTTAPNIWAMGDVAGGLQFTYISLDDFRIVWSQAGEGPLYTANDRKNVPNSVFIDPPLSTVGLREKEARAQNRNIRIAKLPAAAVPKAQVLKETEGFLKAVVDADTDEILGASLICAESVSYTHLDVYKRQARPH